MEEGRGLNFNPKKNKKGFITKKQGGRESVDVKLLRGIIRGKGDCCCIFSTEFLLKAARVIKF